jgi:hypothetical protein
MIMDSPKETRLKLYGVTANCGNSTLGQNACKHLNNLLSDDADLVVINCQEISLRDAIKELQCAIPKSVNIGIAVSNLRKTRTKFFSLDVLRGNTGIATIVLYNKDKINSAQFNHANQLNTQSGNNSNKGGSINQLLITEKNGTQYKIKTITAHLGSYEDEERILDWQGIKAGAACQGKSWEELIAHVPHLQIAGYDANTRSLWKKRDTSYELINLWHQPTLAPQIAPLFFAPLGTQLYSAEDTYKLKPAIDGVITKTIVADKCRPGYANAGSLDFVAIQNNTDDTELMKRPTKNHYHDAKLNIITEKGSDRDHQIIVSDRVELLPIIEFNCIRHDIAAQLLQAAPRLSNEILLLPDSPENRLRLVKIYEHYLSRHGKLIRRILFNKTNLDEPVTPWFELDTLAPEKTLSQLGALLSQVSLGDEYNELSEKVRL